jgi:hypothetical protein
MTAYNLDSGPCLPGQRRRPMVNRDEYQYQRGLRAAAAACRKRAEQWKIPFQYNIFKTDEAEACADAIERLIDAGAEQAPHETGHKPVDRSPSAPAVPDLMPLGGDPPGVVAAAERVMAREAVHKTGVACYCPACVAAARAAGTAPDVLVQPPACPTCGQRVSGEHECYDIFNMKVLSSEYIGEYAPRLRAAVAARVEAARQDGRADQRAELVEDFDSATARLKQAIAQAHQEGAAAVLANPPDRDTVMRWCMAADLTPWADTLIAGATRDENLRMAANMAAVAEAARREERDACVKLIADHAQVSPHSVANGLVAVVLAIRARPQEPADG